ncbi:helicase [Sulfurimonas sp. MAG313]|nr:SUV3 C-terminal domain-containing protein [Sulfurimonas sp. MAG313]MDF1880800.1 helicase [Sulfurimonas sp. MAG313]
MAKKKKKLSKYNQIIRNYFDGDGFDEGIVRVPFENLIELGHRLGMRDISPTHEHFVRGFRRLWSEAEIEYREEIVAYFQDLGQIFSGSGERKAASDKTEKINSFLDQMSLSDEEANDLHKHFENERTKRISLPKMQKVLYQIRLAKKLKVLERSLEISFTQDNALEFYTPIHFSYAGESFTKILQIKTDSLSYTMLEESDIDDLRPDLNQEKNKFIKKKQDEADLFMESLGHPHKYLLDTEVLQSLRTMPPENIFEHTPVSEKILRAVFARHFKAESLQLMDYNLIMHKEAKFSYEGHTLSYEALSEIPLKDFIPRLWEGKEIDFDDDFSLHNEMLESSFKEDLESLINFCEQSASILDFDRKEIVSFVMQALEGTVPDLHISPKQSRRILFNFNKSIEKLKLKKQREALLARTIRDFKNLFPTARELRRKLIFHVGPTNSGKTYAAMKKLEKADTGYYLAPLRLLALEGYENLKADGTAASLITGEEQIVDEFATHISSTIEMLNFNIDVDVCVIDEVQMLSDRDRGWAWANAIIGAPAKEVYMTGSLDALEAIQALADWLGEELEVIYFERKNPLSMMSHATPLNAIEPQTAVIAFSRKDVLQLKQQLSRNYKVSVVYGNLSPEVRREEARRFRDGETEVLVATDAISMGLNLPIKTILFSKDNKFDGIRRRTLKPGEVIQIAGRAGRYGMEEEGYVGALNPSILKTVHEQFHEPLKSISLPLNVMANLEHILLVGKILETQNLEEILHFFIEHMTFDGPFRVANLESLIEVAQYTDKYNLDLSSKYHMACAPLSTQSPYLVQMFSSYIAHMEVDKPVPYEESKIHGEYAESMETLLHIEDLVKEVSLYLWLNYRFPEIFFEPEKARDARKKLNKYIEKTLKHAQFVPKCKICTKPISLDSKHAICNACFRQRRHLSSEQRTDRRPSRSQRDKKRY